MVFWEIYITKKGGSSVEEPPYIAEREGFEPPVPLGTAVFKTAVIDHSTTFPWCDLGGARTLDPMIKSHLLYQLSYQVIFSAIEFLLSNHRLFLDCGCKGRLYF